MAKKSAASKGEKNAMWGKPSHLRMFNQNILNEMKNDFEINKINQTNLAKKYKCGTSTIWRFINSNFEYKTYK